MPYKTYSSVDLDPIEAYDSPHDLEASIPMAQGDLGHDYLLGRRLGHYSIVEKVGEGGMGQVYRGRDEHLARDVAIKVLPPGTLADENARRRFRKEAQTLSQLNHPNIATIYDFDTCDGVDFLAMELVGGQTLDAKLALGPLTEKEIAQLGTQLAEALVAAHAAGVIHRDIKPGNLKVRGDGRLKVLDFGLARALQPVLEGSTTTALVESSAAAGTLPYMAPEQLREEALDARTDIYGAGAVLYEMSTGKRPFRETSGPLLVETILHRAPPIPSALNHRVAPQLEGVILKCLQKEPEDRYATAADLLVDLRGLQHHGQDGRTPPRRNTLALLVRAVITLGLLAPLAFLPPVRRQLQTWLHIPSMPNEKLVAVLPFEVTGGDEHAAPFSDGLTETLTAKLTELTLDPKLQVISAPEVRSKGVKTMDAARHEFGATMVVEGSMHWFNGSVRINVALADTRTRRQLRAESLTVSESDPFAVQDQVVNAAIEMLELNLQPEDLQKLSAHGTQTASAYDFYLQGRGYLQNYDDPENVHRAIRSFSKAVELDPRYALAYAGRGDAYWQMYESGKGAKWIAPSRESCQQALSLVEDLPAARSCLGTLAKGTGRYQEAAAEFERVLRAEPTNDRAYMELGESYELLGDPARAEATYRRAINLRPGYWAGYNWLGVFYYHQARYRQAAEMFEQVRSHAPDNVRGMFNLGAAYVGLGRYADAISVLEQSLAIRPEGLAYTNLGNAYFYLHRYDKAVSAYEQATRLEPEDMLLWWNLGDGYYWLGKRAQAGAAYGRAISLATSRLKINAKDSSLLGILAICHAMRDEKKLALEALQRGLRLSPADPDLLFKAALIYNHFGETLAALAWLKKSLAAGLSASTVRDTPDFDHLGQDPRFQELLRGS